MSVPGKGGQDIEVDFACFGKMHLCRVSCLVYWFEWLLNASLRLGGKYQVASLMDKYAEYLNESDDASGESTKMMREAMEHTQVQGQKSV